MFSAQDVNNIECDEEVSELDYFLSVQRAINGGMWSLQGSYGRTMMEAITVGRCMLGNEPARDYWGNRIPSRFEVKEGTKGSYDYVVNAYGPGWAAAMAGA